MYLKYVTSRTIKHLNQMMLCISMISTRLAVGTCLVVEVEL